jgi:hypothetical protein
MKKLIFAASLAIVAVGSAYAQEYSKTSGGITTTFNCDGLIEPLCSTAAPALPWRTIPGNAPISSPPADYDQTYQQVNP